MKKIIFQIFVCCIASLPIYAQHVGIGTEDPQAMLDINGDVVLRTADIAILDSITLALDVNTEKFSRYRITDADSAFGIAGITAGMDGRIVTLVNQTGFPMILHHADTLADDLNRIVTGNQEALSLDDMGTVSLQYDTAMLKWMVNSSNHVPAGSDVWDTTGTDIFFDNFVGIGTENPTAPLSIETILNEPGFSHMSVSGADSIKLESSITNIGAAIGTTSDDIFSLNAGGVAKVHIWPDGNVVIGDDPDPANFTGNHTQSRTDPIEGKLSILTPINSTGWMHIAGPDSIIVDESIGGVSASIGTSTNHTLRLKTNGLGRLHIWPDGKVIIGNNVQPAIGQLTAYTLNNSNGLTHVGGDGQIVSTHIGGSSGTIGTYTPHHFRIVCNSLSAISIVAATRNVGIGLDFPTEKFSVLTPNSNFGISHRSEGGIFLSTHIGEVSASFGAFSNHNFRLVTNGLPRLNITYDGKVGIGTINPIHLFEVNGTMRAKELIIETSNWPDYVFEKEYKSLTLEELDRFIQQHHHLPNIPSARMMEENGIAVGDMQKLMMEKIEELTLYVIQLQKNIDDLKKSKY